MKYDFVTRPDRRDVGAFKWMDMYRRNPSVSPDVVPMSVADMEFVNAPEIIEGLKDYISNNVLGYTGPTDAYFDAVISWMTRRHGFTPKREWILQSPGVVPALYELVPALTEPNEAVLICTPVYHPFRHAVEESKRELVCCELIERDRSCDVDFEDFERKAKLPSVKLFILCSPHNPVGRVWTKAELQKMLKICRENGVTVVADEIHGDLIMPGVSYVSTGTLTEELDNLVICTAPSKTFNLAGMQTSNIIIPNADLRKRFNDAAGYHSLNALGYKACEYAYNQCEGWLDELITVIDSNRALVEEFLKDKLPMLIPFRLEGTYLLWVDCRKLGMNHTELENFLENRCQLFFNDGFMFGEGGDGFVRINLACPKSVVEEALERLCNGIKNCQ
ncbi:MAG TPA: MalY/PatB family protein [Eubacteriales bacterium]|nr:MalY/PatB family protein [Clostridia bacterium]HRV73675.1 MalY/PatB family protein [Eubacteriales bacterium]